MWLKCRAWNVDWVKFAAVLQVTMSLKSLRQSCYRGHLWLVLVGDLFIHHQRFLNNWRVATSNVNLLQLTVVKTSRWCGLASLHILECFISVDCVDFVLDRAKGPPHRQCAILLSQVISVFSLIGSNDCGTLGKTRWVVPIVSTVEIMRGCLSHVLFDWNVSWHF